MIDGLTFGMRLAVGEPGFKGFASSPVVYSAKAVASLAATLDYYAASHASVFRNFFK